MGEPDTNSLDKIYAEAGQWVRMCNVITWSIGALLIPLSIGCIGLAQKYPPHKRFLAGASIVLFAVWVYVSKLYRKTAADARKVLMNIEDTWGVPEQMALYQLHGQVGLRWYSVFNVQIVSLILLALLWVVLLMTDKVGAGSLGCP
jgi:hypothetical protein